VVTVSGKGSGRISIAGLVCFQPGRRASPPRLIYRTRTHRGRKGERRSFSERDYADLLDAAHQQLGGPIMLVWDNLNTHISRAMREFIAARDWLRVYRLPAYAPELNGRRRRMGQPQKRAGQPPLPRPGQPEDHDQNPAQRHAVPARPAHRFPRPHRPVSRTSLTLIIQPQ
jgi:hypothetical protein